MKKLQIITKEKRENFKNYQRKKKRALKKKKKEKIVTKGKRKKKKNYERKK